MRKHPTGLVRKQTPAERAPEVGVAPVPISLDANPAASFLFRQTGVLSSIEVLVLDGNPDAYCFEWTLGKKVTVEEWSTATPWNPTNGFEIEAGTLLTLKVTEGARVICGALFTPRAGVRVAKTQKDTVHV